MITSMTGFGRGSADVDGVTATVEMRSVNNRFIDVSIRLPNRLSAYEADIQTRIRQAFERGRINVNVQLDIRAEDQLPVQANEALARAYRTLLDDVRAAAGLEDPVRLEHVLRFSDVITNTDESPETTEKAWEAVQAALTDAIADMQDMRRREGEALRADLAARIDAIEQALIEVERRAPERIPLARERLQQRLRELLDDDRLDPLRLEQEIAILADRIDITEECVRLRSHLVLFRDALDSEEAVGRRLNFLVQEIHREVNTISAKANDAPIAHLTVTMKEEVEKIREQVQNVE